MDLSRHSTSRTPEHRMAHKTCARRAKSLDKFTNFELQFNVSTSIVVFKMFNNIIFLIPGCLIGKWRPNSEYHHNPEKVGYLIFYCMYIHNSSKFRVNSVWYMNLQIKEFQIFLLDLTLDWYDLHGFTAVNN